MSAYFEVEAGRKGLDNAPAAQVSQPSLAVRWADNSGEPHEQPFEPLLRCPQHDMVTAGEYHLVPSEVCAYGIGPKAEEPGNKTEVVAAEEEQQWEKDEPVVEEANIASLCVPMEANVAGSLEAFADAMIFDLQVVVAAD